MKPRGISRYAALLPLSWMAISATTAVVRADERLPVRLTVSLDSAGLPPTFLGYSPELQERIRMRIEEMALDRCDKQFPYYHWVGSTTSPSDREVAHVEIRLTGNGPNALPTIRLETSARNADGLFESVQFPSGELFPSGDPLPDWDPSFGPERVDQLVEEFREKGCDAVRDVFVANLHIWKTVMRDVPIALVVLVREQQQLLILPLKAEQLRAARMSTVEIGFHSEASPGARQVGYVQARPAGESLDEEHFGLQEFSVTRFEFAPLVSTVWHDQIPSVLRDNVIPETVRVYMVEYVRSNRLILRTP